MNASAVVLVIAFPFSISTKVLSINSLVFITEFALSDASLPIWSATTAKPLPASPALAASIEALSDKRLVWEAMSSISVIILPISLEISVIRSISVRSPFIFSFSSLALFAEAFTLSDALFVSFAVSAARLTTVSIVAFSSSITPACSVAPSAKDLDAFSTSWAFEDTFFEISVISERVLLNLFKMNRSECLSSEKSPRKSVMSLPFLVKSPCAINFTSSEISRT